MKHLLLTTIAAVVLVGCGESQQSAAPVNPEAVSALLDAARKGDIQAVKQAIAAGVDVNAKNKGGDTPLDWATGFFNKPKIADLLRKHGGKTGEELKAEGK